MMQDIKEKMLEFDNLFLKQLSYYGFRKKKKHVFVRKQGDCLQKLTITETKIRGEPTIYINIHVAFSYEKINRVIYFIRNEEYDASWSTASTNVCSLIKDRNLFGFYVSESTELEPFVQDISCNIVPYALDFLESCNTLDKYEKMLLDRNEDVRLAPVKKIEWNLLALAILLGHRTVEEILDEYEDAFKKNLSLLQTAKERIKEYDVVKECGI
ncbi:MAG: hypothetical protein NC321_10875 [Clostridium sp.]|nr:hypothetical protein [Clostridium sp.]